MRQHTIVALLAAFGIGVLAGRAAGPTASAQDKAAADPYSEILHVGVLVKDLDQAVARWKAMGFSDIRVSAPNKGVDRTYHGKPIDVALRQAFVHGTRPMIFGERIQYGSAFQRFDRLRRLSQTEQNPTTLQESRRIVRLPLQRFVNQFQGLFNIV